MRKLHEIRSDILFAVEKMILEALGETPIDGLSLEELEIEAEEKIANCSWVVARLEAEAAEADIVIKNAQAYKAARTKSIERIEADIKVTMEVMGLDKIDRPDCRVTLGSARERAEILDENLLPDEYMRIKKEPAKTDILNALKAGKEIPGAKIGYGERSLRYLKLKGE